MAEQGQGGLWTVRVVTCAPCHITPLPIPPSSANNPRSLFTSSSSCRSRRRRGCVTCASKSRFGACACGKGPRCPTPPPQPPLPPSSLALSAGRRRGKDGAPGKASRRGAERVRRGGAPGRGQTQGQAWAHGGRALHAAGRFRSTSRQRRSARPCPSETPAIPSSPLLRSFYFSWLDAEPAKRPGPRPPGGDGGGLAP